MTRPTVTRVALGISLCALVLCGPVTAILIARRMYTVAAVWTVVCYIALGLDAFVFLHLLNRH